MPNFCPNCGAALKYPEAEICPSCGVRIREPPVAKNEWTKIIIAILAAVAVVAVLLAAALYIVMLIGQVSGPPAAVANVSVVTPAAQFVNPGFETGTLYGWTAGSTTFTLGDRSHSGTYSCHFDMSGTTATDYLSQSVDLTGATEISFWGMGESNTWPFSVYIDGRQVQTSNAVSSTWVRYTVPVSGYADVHTVSVKWNGGPGNYGADIDDFAIS